MKISVLAASSLIALLVVVLFAGWQRERQRASELAEECKRLSLELTSARREPSTSQVEIGSLTLTDVRPEVLENSGLSDSKELIGNTTSNLVAMIAEVETDTVMNLESEHGATHTMPTPSVVFADEPPLYSDAQLEIYRCCNNLGVITLAAERWAADHDGLIPENLMALRGYLPPMLLICPSIRPKTLSAGWEHFSPADITYRVLSSSNGKMWDFQIAGHGSPATVGWLVCPAHNLRALNRKMSAGIPSSQVFRPR